MKLYDGAKLSKAGSQVIKHVEESLKNDPNPRMEFRALSYYAHPTLWLEAYPRVAGEICAELGLKDAEEEAENPTKESGIIEGLEELMKVVKGQNDRLAALESEKPEKEDAPDLQEAIGEALRKYGLIDTDTDAGKSEGE